jgi:hypothetical protein
MVKSLKQSVSKLKQKESKRRKNEKKKGVVIFLDFLEKKNIR